MPSVYVHIEFILYAMAAAVIPVAAATPAAMAALADLVDSATKGLQDAELHCRCAYTSQPSQHFRLSTFHAGCYMYT